MLPFQVEIKNHPELVIDTPSCEVPFQLKAHGSGLVEKLLKYIQDETVKLPQETDEDVLQVVCELVPLYTAIPCGFPFAYPTEVSVPL